MLSSPLGLGRGGERHRAHQRIAAIRRRARNDERSFLQRIGRVERDLARRAHGAEKRRALKFGGQARIRQRQGSAEAEHGIRATASLQVIRFRKKQLDSLREHAQLRQRNLHQRNPALHGRRIGQARNA